MYNSTFQLRAYFFGFLLAIGMVLPGAAQTQMRADDYQDNQAFNTVSPALAVDADISSASTLNLVGLVGAALRVVFPGTIQSGQQAILYVKPAAPGSLPDAALRWETASEHNTDYFEVQRAEGPASGYSSLGRACCGPEWHPATHA